MVTNTGSRFQPVEVAAQMPGVSFLTKNHTGPFIDTGKVITKEDHWWGRVYLSFDEIREMADQAGMFEEYERRIADVEDSKREVLASYESGVQQSWDAGYAAGRAENLDDLADQLVDRMRSRVDRDRDVVAERASDEPGADADDSAAAPAAGASAEPAGVEEPAGVSGARGRRSADGGAAGA